MKTASYRFPGKHISAATLTIVALVSSGAALRADNIFVANGTGNNVTEFTSGGVGSIFATTGLNNPNGMAFDASGNLYVDNYAGNTIEKFTPGGVGSVFTSSGLSAPYAMAFDNSGNLYVANAGTGFGQGYIEKYTSGGIGAVLEGGIGYPVGLAISGANLYVADFNGNSIQRFGLGGGAGSTFAATGLSSPEGIAFDAAGNLYVANIGNGQAGNGYIEKYTPGGVGSVFASGLNFPYGLAFDSAGDLFATSRGTSDQLIYEFTPGGTPSTFADTGLADPEFLAVQATPEPSTWALLGIGGIGLIYSCRGRIFGRRHLSR